MMNRIQNMQLGSKVFSAIVFVLVLELFVSATGIYFMKEINSRIDTIVDVDTEEIRLANRLGNFILRILRSEKDMILSDDPKVIRTLAADIDHYREAIDSGYTRLSNITATENLGLLRDFHAHYLQFMALDTRIKQMVLDALDTRGEEAGVMEREASALSMRRGRKAFEDALSSLDAVSVKIEQDLGKARSASNEDFTHALAIKISILLLSIATGFLVAGFVTRSLANALKRMMSAAEAIAAGQPEVDLPIERKDEVGRLSKAMQEMRDSLRNAAEEANAQNWLKSGVSRLDAVMRGDNDMPNFCRRVIGEVAEYLDAKVAAFYVTEFDQGQEILRFSAGYAYRNPRYFSGRFSVGEGLVGQAALKKEMVLLGNVPADYIKVASGLGESVPRALALVPLIHQDAVTGVIECGFLNPPDDLKLEYLRQIVRAVAVNLVTVEGREKLARALAESRNLADELQAQQEELRIANEELEEQAELLKESESRLEEQQEELEAANEELEENNQYLERQKETIAENNRLLAKSRLEIQKKAEELARSGKYKSEFLANMSHELRTPLNSMLLLTDLLLENPEDNLTADQVESAQIIHHSGNQLLALINDILDLSKIEAGRMDVKPENFPVEDLAESIRIGFQRMAEEKGLKLAVRIEKDTPEWLKTDRQRLDQILRNLVSNAVKFTETGEVSVTIARSSRDTDFARGGLSSAKIVAFEVRDTGIGIPKSQQRVIFEAFQQVEGGDAKRFGGTGLGLSISRELAHLLGGEIQVKSKVGEGTTFTLYIPENREVPPEQIMAISQKSVSGDLSTGTVSASNQRKSAGLQASALKDDRGKIGEPGDRTVLIIEDDVNFASILMRLCREKGFKCIEAVTGEEGVELAKEYRPNAVLLDIMLPGMDGWSVLAALKNTPETRHIPVHVVSVEEAEMEAVNKGAVGFLKKPATRENLEAALKRLGAVFEREVKNLLVVEDDERQQKNIVKLIGNGDVLTDVAGTGKEALDRLQNKKYDCMILDLGLPDMNGFQLLAELENLADPSPPPVIVYSGKDLTREEVSELQSRAESIIIKGVRSEERLLDEVSLFLHRIVDKMPVEKRRIIKNLYDIDVLFRGKTVLIVDDDMRNVFALSQVLGKRGMVVLKAENGEKALRTMQEHPEIDIVLMDIMMPVMDGIETMERIRSQDRYRDLPIIALTAKAMKEDSAKSLNAGASDYLSKPVDLRRLFSLMRVWLYR